ncbi:SMI1/KNR4 family protein [Kosakonia oryzendophytica]|uniref:SMI1/KNR4 family protein n=1 Tax=Kosakonia TaxID=1330547 RepID=UPI0021D8437C|nr:SMI1/KNR4 family protein [Kosakonia sp. ML.JS2a]UXY11488.1 SMI1/KNR4 family protein [Kosakonia sp. ML.JS2a]
MMGTTPFAGFDFTDFWDDREYAREAYINAPFSEDELAAIESTLGYRLPASYIWLMRQHNGGIPRNQNFPTNEFTSWAEDHIAITGIMGIGNKRYSLGSDFGSRFWIEHWGYPDIGVAICNCPSAGHDMVFLDYRQCLTIEDEPTVVHIDQEQDYRIVHLADNFEAFIRGLVDDDAFEL